MQFLCFKPKNDVFFEAAIRNDLQKIKECSTKLMNYYDRRESSHQDQINQGFYAIHYAVLHGSIKVMEFLLQNEYMSRTKCAYTCKLPQLNNQVASFPSGLDILHIALIQQNYQLVRYLLSHKTVKTKQLIGTTDENGNTHLMATTWFPLDTEVIKLIVSTEIVNEFPVQQLNRQGYIYKVCQFKRVDHMRLVVKLLGMYPELLNSFYQQLLAVVQQNQTLIQIADSDIDYEFWRSNAYNKEVLTQFVTKISLQAIKHLLQQNMTNSYIITQFVENCGFEVNLSMVTAMTEYSNQEMLMMLNNDLAVQMEQEQ